MQQRNIDFLNQHKNVYDFYKLSGELRQIGHPIREEFLRIAREEWAANYLCCLTCTGDVIRLVEFVYTQFNKAKLFIETVPAPVKERKKK
jgi:hypothetical protein